MKHQIDELIEDEYLQRFLIWVNQKARSVAVSRRPVVVRAFYLDLAFARVLNLVGSSISLARACNADLTYTLDSELALDLALDHILASHYISRQVLSRALRRMLDRAIDRAQAISPPLEQALRQLKQQLPESGVDAQGFKAWWEDNYQTWSQQLRTIVLEYRNLGHDWQFNDFQKERLKQYYHANELLLNCLNSDSKVTDTARREIEGTMLCVNNAGQLTASYSVEKAPSIQKQKLPKLSIYC